MSKDRPTGQPYKALGDKLKAARISRQRTIAEASGAIELDESTFKQIEKGQQRPAEDILMVLISYLEIQDDEADSLWELAGYNDTKAASNMFDLGQTMAMVMPMDLRVVYTDMVHVMINDFGVTMNFLQGAGPGNQPLAVARIGMSKEHAKSVLEILDKSLKQSDRHKTPKQLKSASQSTDQNSQQNSK